MYKNLVINAFGDLVERTDYGNHKNQLNLFDNLNEVVEENITTDDILDFLSKSNRNRPKIVAGFSAETNNVIKNSTQKMKNKNCDLIFANDVSRKDIGFNSDFNKVSVIDQKGNIKIIPKNRKSFIANKIAHILLDKLLDDRNFN